MVALPTLNGASPLNASDDSRLLFTADASPETLSRALDDTPTDFGNMDTLSWQVEYRQQGRGDDTLLLGIRIVNGATILAAADSGGTFQSVSADIQNTADTTSAVTAFSYVNTTADKTAWDGASIELEQSITKTKGADGCNVEVDYVAVTGTYTAGAVTHDLTAQDHSAAASHGQPTISQTHALTGSDVDAASSHGQPTISQEHALTALDHGAAASFGQATLSEAHALTALGHNAAASHGQPTISQEHALAPQDLDATSSHEQPTISQEHALTAQDHSAAASIGQPTVGEGATDDLTSLDHTAAASMETPVLGQTHVLGAQDLSALSAIGQSTIGQVHALDLSSLLAAASHGPPTIGQEHNLGASDLLAVASIGQPREVPAASAALATQVQVGVTVGV